MKVHVEPVGLHSRAMIRVANALSRYAPDGIEFTSDPLHCDMQVLHVIAADAISYARDLRNLGRKYAVVQYCMKTAGGSPEGWKELWENSEVVWSYYDLSKMMSDMDCRAKFLYGPLGVDTAFRLTPGPSTTPRSPLVVTSGYVNGPGAEAIEPVWRAANATSTDIIHIGPRNVVGTTYRPRRIEFMSGLSDRDLADIYCRARWVSGLRHVEGFELPAAEGLACGATPLLFDHLYSWYGPWGNYFSELYDKLVNQLCLCFDGPWQQIDESTHRTILNRFDWAPICARFWNIVTNTHPVRDKLIIV